MSFLLRAALAIGVLSYIASLRQGAPPGPSIDTARLRSTVEMTTGSLATLGAVLPPEARANALRMGAEALARPLAGPPSADTLSATDRLPPWRGTGGR